MSIKHPVLLLCVFLACQPEQLPYVSNNITSQELRRHLLYLASDELEGRAAGLHGNDLAAGYIADQFSNYGLTPLGVDNTYFQEFKVLTGLKPGDRNSIAIVRGESVMTLSPEEDFVPLSISSDTTVSGELVFVGYGIRDDSLNYNDYAGIDVRGKIVLVLRYSPDYGRPDSRFYDHAPLYRKAMVAKEQGALGMILVTGPADEEKPSLIPLRSQRLMTSAGMAAVNIQRPAVDSILLMAGVEKNLRTLQQEIYDSKSPRSFRLSGTSARIQTEIVKISSLTRNVIGFLEGNDPARKQEVIVVGAHFDHVGWGGPGSGSLRPDTAAIHNGADDNASGISALLEIAQALFSQRQNLKRSYVFIAFSAEELGLLGSAHFVSQPTVPLGRILAMVNLDMVGRLRDSSLTVEGVGTSPAWKPMLEKENEAFGFTLRLGQGGFGPSDHASFYGKDIPVLFFFTGLHEDYHRPSDDWQKINYEGQRSIAQYVFQLLRRLDDVDKPPFTRVQVAATDSAGRRGFRVTLGILPDYSEAGNGLRISGTRHSSPAEKAGLKSGDVITKFGGKEIKNIYDLTYLLGDYKPGDEVVLVFIREGEVQSVTVKLEARR